MNHFIFPGCKTQIRMSTHGHGYIVIFFFIFGIFFAIAMAWVFAVCNVLNRKLKNLNFLLVLFAHGSVGLVMSIVYILAEKVITGNPFRFYTAY